MKSEIVLIGGGGHCKACIDVIELDKNYHIAGIVDVPERLHQRVLGYEIIATDHDLFEIAQEYSLLIAIGQIKSPTKRIQLYSKAKRAGAKFPVIKSPLAYVSPHARIGEGTIIMHNALINAGATVGTNCIINTKSLVEHDAVIKDHCHIATSAVVNGGVRIGAGSFVGSGTILKEGVEVIENTVISYRNNNDCAPAHCP